MHVRDRELLIDHKEECCKLCFSETTPHHKMKSVPLAVEALRVLAKLTTLPYGSLKSYCAKYKVVPNFFINILIAFKAYDSHYAIFK